MTANAQIVAARLRVAKNFMLLIDSGVESQLAADIVKQHKGIAFSNVLVADDKIVICYKTCTSEIKVDFKLAA